LSFHNPLSLSSCDFQHPNNPLSASSNAATPSVVGTASTKAVSCPQIYNTTVSDYSQETKHEALESSPMVPIKDVRQRGRLELSSPPDKPLPSLPVATIQTGSPIIRRSLIDAREKPLRRSISPSPGEKAEEEWPVLFPSRTTSLQEIPPDGSLKQARSPEGDKSIPNAELAHCDQQHTDESQDGIDATSADRNLRQDYLSAHLPSGNASDSAQASMASETTTKVIKPRSESPAMLSNAKGSSPIVADGDTFNSVTHTDHGFLKERNPEQSLSANDNKSSSPTGPVDGVIRSVKNASSPQGGVRARASKLPKRFSAPGPVRNSSSPRRTSSRGPLPYGPLPLPTYRGRPVRHDCHSNSMGRQTGRNTPPSASQATHSANFTFEDVPSLVVVKQSSKTGVADSGRSSIPRPRNHSKRDEDGDSESEIMVSKLPRRKLNRNCLTSEHKSEDGDIDTDEDRERKEEKPSKASDTAAERNRIAESLEHERPNTGAIGRAVSSPTKSEGLASLAQDLSSEGQNCSSGILDKDLNCAQSVADSASIIEPYFSTARQRQLIDKPFNRVKRLSANSPDHGPILRISESAERVIMGHRSEENNDGHDTKAQKRNSVPDLRRSIVIKELRKSTEGLLNGLSPISRSLTTRSLNRPECRDESSESRSKDETMPSRSELYSPNVRLSAPSFHDPFSACGGKILAEADDPGRKSGSEDPVDWPLRGPVQAAGDLHPVEEAKAEEERPWISPLHMSHIEAVSERKSPSPIRSSEGGQSKAVDNSGRVSRREIARSPPEDANAPRVSREPVPVTINEIRSAIHRKAQFPPRTSSRANTPDISMRSRPQINQNTSRDIPNRFVSLHANRLSQEFGVPKSTTVEPEILRSSIHKRKDNGNSNFSSPITRETGRGQLSSAKGMLSNFKGLFHKRSIETTPASSRSKSKDTTPHDRPTSLAMNSSPHPNYHSRMLPANCSANRSARGGAHMIRRPRDAFPQSPGLHSDDFRNATDLAIRVLDASQSEVDGVKKRRLLQASGVLPRFEMHAYSSSQFGELMVEAVTGARDAEKAMEEAKQAAARAEMHCMRGKKSVLELTRLVGQELNEN
jgi:hypothetical protein